MEFISEQLLQTDFECFSLEIFKKQYFENQVYRDFSDLLKRNPKNVQGIDQIPFLPIEFFKTHRILLKNQSVEVCFSSSGTTSSQLSKHYVSDLQLYIDSFRKGFSYFYGDVTTYVILALLPSYLERSGSSLIYMVDDLINQSNNKNSGFYLYNTTELAEKLSKLDASGQKVLLIGVTYALLDLVEKHKFNLKNTIVMETGGMKGRRKELVREELHSILKKGFSVNKIHSEYGMTELLSQGYSKGEGIFYSPPWMKIIIRDTEDPLSLLPVGKTGGVNIIDLANINSCSFIATQDLGVLTDNGGFKIQGRFDHSDIRGCNLMLWS